MNKVPEDFQPSQTVYSYAHKEGIPNSFVDEEINEFIAYWTLRAVNKSLRGWHLTFLNRIKWKWSYKKEAEKKSKTRCSVPFREMEKIEKSTSRISLKQRLRET